MDANDPLWTELRGRYRPERPLGAGGMAEVWLVHDERHDRLVALKLLGEHLASAMGQDRFKREIALLARLQHPNVLSLIDSGAGPPRVGVGASETRAAPAERQAPPPRSLRKADGPSDGRRHPASSRSVR